MKFWVPPATPSLLLTHLAEELFLPANHCLLFLIIRTIATWKTRGCWSLLHTCPLLCSHVHKHTQSLSRKHCAAQQPSQHPLFCFVSAAGAGIQTLAMLLYLGIPRQLHLTNKNLTLNSLQAFVRGGAAINISGSIGGQKYYTISPSQDWGVSGLDVKGKSRSDTHRSESFLSCATNTSLDQQFLHCGPVRPKQLLD